MIRGGHRHAGAGLCLWLAAACGDGDGDNAPAPLDATVSDSRVPDGAAHDAQPEDARVPNDAAGRDAELRDAEPEPPEPDASPSLQVTRYDYAFDLAQAHASATVTLQAPESGGGCTRLKSQLPLDALRVSSSTPFEVRQQGELVELCGNYQAGQQVTLYAEDDVPLRSDPGTGVGFSERSDGGGSSFRYLLGWIEACSLFGPCDPRPSSLARFTFDITHGPADVVLCPGTREASVGHTRCTLLDTLAPTYSSFAIAANPAFRSRLLTRAADVDVLVYEGAHGTLFDSLNADAVAAFLDWLSTELGPFPYGNEVRVAGAPVHWLGMEHPANIVLREDLKSVPNLYADVPLHTLLHELAHQWAGNRVTLQSALDYAWKEAIAEYLVYTFEQLQRPAIEAQTTLKVWHSTGVGAPYPVRPLETPTVPLWVWTSGAYGSGPMTLFVQLEPYLGRDALLRAIRDFLSEPGARGMQDLQAALERASGHSLQTYFNAWVYGRGEIEWPAFYVQTEPLGHQLQIRVTQTHDTRKRFPCVLELELHAEPDISQRVLVDFGLEPSAYTKVVTVEFDEPLTSLRIDPDGKLLDWSLNAKKARPQVAFHP